MLSLRPHLLTIFCFSHHMSGFTRLGGSAPEVWPGPAGPAALGVLLPLDTPASFPEGSSAGFRQKQEAASSILS